MHKGLKSIKSPLSLHRKERERLQNWGLRNVNSKEKGPPKREKERGDHEPVFPGKIGHRGKKC